MSPSRPVVPYALAALAVLAGCSSKVDSVIDPGLEAKVDTVRNCIPPHLERLEELLTFADLWRLNDNSNNPADPPELSWSYAGGQIDYTITLPTLTITGIIRFYSPSGGQEAGLTLSSVSLSQAIDDAATELRNLHPTGRPFMVGEWTFSGASVGSAGVTSSPAAFTGMIGGSANQNELEELRTTEGVAAVAGGPPPVQACTITATGAETCVFTFTMTSLVTDGSPAQEYPIGTIDFTLENQTSGTTVSGSLVLDGTVTARLNVATIPGHFDINLETFSITHVL